MNNNDYNNTHNFTELVHNNIVTYLINYDSKR